MDDFLFPFGERRQCIHQFLTNNNLGNVDMLLSLATGVTQAELSEEFHQLELDKWNSRLLAGRIFSLSKLLFTSY
jgi:hypothetical protein